MEKLIFISTLALGGALGAVTRYGVGVALTRGAPGFPWGVFAVNMVGAFLFGVIWAISGNREWFSDTLRDVILIGFLGALTTFSTFAFNNLELLLEGRWPALVFNVLVSNVGGLVLVWFGVRLVRSDVFT